MDLRDENCAIRLKDESGPYPRSGCCIRDCNRKREGTCPMTDNPQPVHDDDLYEVFMFHKSRMGEPDDVHSMHTSRIMASLHKSHVGTISKTITALKSHAAEKAAMQARIEHLEGALTILACLGNGDRLGNSNGNMIARQALNKPNTVS